MAVIRKASQSEAAHITRRLLACMPSGQFEMHTLTRLAAVVATRDVPTASVECKRRPRMLINPDFVAENCERDEHLFLLVMHELWHVLLAHTRMYPFSTPAHNIAFDAIINAGLMAKFSTPEYMGFFDKLYKADEFPFCLLRPPEGWPFNPVYPDVGPPGTRQIIERLYPRNNFRPFFGQKPLYEEILQLLMDSGMNFPMPLLLGSHGEGELRNPDGSPMNDPFMKNALKEAMKKWKPMKIDGRGYGGDMSNWDVDVAPDFSHARRKFSEVLQKVLGNTKGRNYRRAKMPINTTGGNGVLINPRDRLIAARRQLGVQALLYSQPTEVKARIPERPALAHVYLDVSGSMADLLPHMLSLLIPYVMKHQASVFQFSTEVTELKAADLRKGHLTTTGGTNINCVLEHIVEYEGKLQKAIILTDGEVGAPQHNLAAQFREQNIIMHAVLPSGCRMHYRSAPLMRSVVELPPAQ
ncbi:MAG: hypothetical protein AAF787_04680 [Chloroflexota bacterium]